MYVFMIIRKDIDINAPLTPKEIEMLEEMNRRPICFDEDCPPLTDERIKHMCRVSESPQKERFGDKNHTVFNDIVTGLKEAIEYEQGTGEARVQKRSDEDEK